MTQTDRHAAEKSALRAEVRGKIAALPEDYIRRSDGAIRDKILNLPEVRGAQRVFTYFSVGREVDTRGIIQTLGAWGKKIALPVVRGKGLMTFADIAEMDIADRAAVLVPGPGDILLVPALCYDRQNHRLGQGGGYYDRYLANCPAASLGLCRRELLFDRLPAERHDLPVDLVVTD